MCKNLKASVTAPTIPIALSKPTALASADPDVVEDQVYRCFRLDACDRCRKAVIAKPLG